MTNIMSRANVAIIRPMTVLPLSARGFNTVTYTSHATAPVTRPPRTTPARKTLQPG